MTLKKNQIIRPESFFVVVVHGVVGVLTVNFNLNMFLLEFPTKKRNFFLFFMAFGSFYLFFLPRQCFIRCACGQSQWIGGWQRCYCG